MALGQMHPISYYETINYDLRRGHPLFEQNVFKKGYTRVFSDFSRKHIKDNYEMDYSTDEWLRSGTSPQKKNFPNWNIVPEGILISFEDYQIAAHSFGQLELIVPYRELKGVLRSTALMSSFLGNDGVSRSSGAWLPKKTRERSTKSHETSRKGLLVRVVSCGFVDHSCSPWWAKPVEQLWDATFMPLGVSSYHVRNVHSDR
ncbi:MAG: RsiV family protein [Acidobacteriota bacterium]